MLISIHLPLADVRSFMEGETSRLPLPYWPNLDPDGDFVRHFGPIRAQQGRGVDLGGAVFHDEDRVCRADRALRFTRWPRDKARARPALRCAFRTFFADGSAVAKLDVGISDERPAADLPLDQRLRDCLDLQVVVPGASPRPVRLADAGPRLATSYLAASTHGARPPRGGTPLVRPGSVLVVVQYDLDEGVQLPPDAVRVEGLADPDVEVARWELPYAGSRRPVWLVGYRKRTYPLAAQVRLDLVRLHCERVCLGRVLRHIGTGALEPAARSETSQALQRYLQRTLTAVTSPTAHRSDALAQRAAAIVRAAQALCAPEIEALVHDVDERLRVIDIRGNLRRNTLAWLTAARKPDEVRPIFISFRRADSEDVTGRICDRLAEQFGAERVFMDVYSVPYGLDYVEYIRNQVERCTVVIAVIGSTWLTVAQDGKRRLDDPADPVRGEIETALKRDLPIIPILVHGTTMPRPEDLPEPMRALAHRNGLAVRADPYFHPDMDLVIPGIETFVARASGAAA